MALNPVEQRLVQLAEHWEVFRSDSSKRLLIWQANPNALRFYQAFFEVQKHETEYTVGDLFIVFDAPFNNSVQYSRELKEALVGQYEVSRDDLLAQGITPDWQPDLAGFAHSPAGFIGCLRSFGSSHHESIGHLVAVLMPAEVADPEAFSDWLKRAVSAEVPEALRLVVTDDVEYPLLDPLIAPGLDLIQVDQPDIDALTTAQETFAQEGAVGPAAVFRNYLIGLMTLVEKGNKEQVMTKGKDALEFARQQKWSDQEVVVRLLVAGAFLKEQDFDEAVRHYQAARKTAQQAVEEGHPSGQDLVLQTYFGEAGAYLAKGALSQAMDCYDEAAIVAQRIPNAILSIEAFRMAAYCAAALDQRDEAVSRGNAALDLGERLKADARPMTTLPIAAIDLLRVFEPDRVKEMARLKARHDGLVSDARRKANQQASTLEAGGDPKALQDVETDLEAGLRQIETDVSGELDALATRGTEDFRAVFKRARGLIGEAWPMASLLPEVDSATEEVAST